VDVPLYLEDVELVSLIVEGTGCERWDVSLEHLNGVSGTSPLLEKAPKYEVRPYETPAIRAA
jgi:hypothetical protein